MFIDDMLSPTHFYKSTCKVKKLFFFKQSKKLLLFINYNQTLSLWFWWKMVWKQIHCCGCMIKVCFLFDQMVKIIFPMVGKF